MMQAMRNDSHHHGVGSSAALEVDYLTSAIDSMHLNDAHRSSDASSRSADQVMQTELQKELDRIFEKQARKKLDNVPDYEMPSQFQPGLSLFDHQKEGIRWLIHQERSGGAEAFFTETERIDGTKAWKCNISRETQPLPPKRAKGSILADGK